MKIYHIEIRRFMDTYVVGLAYTSVTHFRIRTAFKRIKMVGLRINLGGKGHVLQASKPQPVVLKLFSR